MRLFGKRKPLTEQQHMQADWLRKVWCPLHIKYPSARNKQAAASAAVWMEGRPGMSFLLATGDATREGLRERWSIMNPGEDFHSWLDSIGDDISDYVEEHPEFIDTLKAIGDRKSY
jgi:hypothetical protein